MPLALWSEWYQHTIHGLATGIEFLIVSMVGEEEEVHLEGLPHITSSS